MLRVLVAEANKVMIGYTALLPVVQLQFGRIGCDIHHLYVCPEWRGQSVGRALIRAAWDQAESSGCEVLTVGAESRNTSAQAFYQANGFALRPPTGPRYAKPLQRSTSVAD